MDSNPKAPKTIDEYLANFPTDIQEILKKIRHIVQKAAPDAQEAISYGIPTFVLNGNLVHFAAFKNHIGFYPTPSGTATFQKELSVYKGAKGSVRFPLEEAIPYDLIGEIVTFRVKENLAKAAAKKKSK
jgi:uncharacterized protein YdhG (YjbR/CyaY superfamily)